MLARVLLLTWRDHWRALLLPRPVAPDDPRRSPRPRDLHGLSPHLLRDIGLEAYGWGPGRRDL